MQEGFLEISDRAEQSRARWKRIGALDTLKAFDRFVHRGLLTKTSLDHSLHELLFSMIDKYPKHKNLLHFFTCSSTFSENVLKPQIISKCSSTLSEIVPNYKIISRYSSTLVENVPKPKTISMCTWAVLFRLMSESLLSLNIKFMRVKHFLHSWLRRVVNLFHFST